MGGKGRDKKGEKKKKIGQNYFGFSESCGNLFPEVTTQEVDS